MSATVPFTGASLHLIAYFLNELASVAKPLVEEGHEALDRSKYGSRLNMTGSQRGLFNMSFVTDHIRRIDSQLDSFQLARIASHSVSSDIHSASDSKRESPDLHTHNLDGVDLRRLVHLQASIKAFSSASSVRAILDAPSILAILQQAELLATSSTTGPAGEKSGSISSQEQDLEWLLISKATAQVYGLVLNLLLDQTIPLSCDIEYWDGVLGSYRYTTLYTIQSSPLRLFGWVQGVYNDAKHRQQNTGEEGDEHASPSYSLSDRWARFYGLLKDSIRERSLTNMQSKLMSPLTISQVEARSKRRHLKRLREMSASGLGVLIDEGMMFEIGDEDSVISKARSDEKEEWKSVVSKSVSLMEAVLHNITILEMGPGEFEETVFMSVDKENGGVQNDEGAPSQTVQIALRLQQLLHIHVPAHVASSRQAISVYGKPSRLMRYWLPATLLLLSGSTIFQFILNREAKIITWIQDLGTTTVDFWYNWVVEPIKKVIGTIRHDKDSEIAIMSKESLRGDKASLERMVVDFATDNPDTSNGTGYTEAQIADVRAKVKEGDLTPVLKAYEKDLRRPFVGTIRGDLIRALLIQIQKTKVDVEVALGGIDSLLKSQELVFGFVGITPGVLVCICVYQWLTSVLAGRRGRIQGQQQGNMIRVLRNVDRILTASTTQNNILSYKEHGLLLCEVHVLRQRAAKILPGEINNDFLEEIGDLVELRTGVERQLRVVERIRWAYAKYIY